MNREGKKQGVRNKDNKLQHSTFTRINHADEEGASGVPE